jgi:hypothetical protein
VVDGDRENAMTDGTGADEAPVDVTAWSWRGEGPYRVSFRAYDQADRRIGETSVDITIGRASAPPPPQPPAP